jgi:hypothetical protein
MISRPSESTSINSGETVKAGAAREVDANTKRLKQNVVALDNIELVLDFFMFLI